MLALFSSCKKDTEAPSGDGDGDGDGDNTPLTGGSGGQMNGTGGTDAPESGGMGGEGAGGTTNPLALPTVLSETGLYQSDMETLGDGVRPFRPRFALWTDDAKKRRWIYLPPGEQIDTTDMDYWELPVGTKLWKEFERDGVRVETRLLQRQFNGVWVMVAYQWRDDLSEADAVPLGVENASGTDHDIPSEEQCWGCHNQMPGRVLGFSAIQLAHDAGAEIPGEPDASEWTLDDLWSEGVLSEEPPQIVLTGTEIELAAAGYLHANCGHCHHPQSAVSGRVNMELRLTVEGVAGTFKETPIYETTVGVPASFVDDPEGVTHRILAKDLAASSVYARFNSLGETYSMPTLGTEIIDPEGEEALRLWIESLDP